MLISKKETRFLHVSQAKDLHGHFELTFLFQIHLEQLMTLFGRFNKVEARCETSGPFNASTACQLPALSETHGILHHILAAASTPRDQKICQTHQSEVCCMAPTSSTRHPTCPML